MLEESHAFAAEHLRRIGSGEATIKDILDGEESSLLSEEGTV